MILMPLLGLLVCISLSYGTNYSIPHWENLECEVCTSTNTFDNINCISLLLFIFIVYPQVGKKYLFSDEMRPWQDAKLECELYGGFLLYLKDIKEQNCLMRYAQSQNLDQWYFTDGKSSDFI